MTLISANKTRCNAATTNRKKEIRKVPRRFRASWLCDDVCACVCVRVHVVYQRENTWDERAQGVRTSETKGTSDARVEANGIKRAAKRAARSGREREY